MSTGQAQRQLRIGQHLAALLERETGILIPEHQIDGFVKKVHGLLPEGMALETYASLIASDDQALRQFIESLCTHETRFFRHPEQFAAVEQHWLAARQARADRPRVRAWSVACSSGEEPYSLAMLLLDHFPRVAGWQVAVLGTDVSGRVLERARHATWPIARAAEIGPERLERYMLRGEGKHVGLMRAKPELRNAVQLQALNLIAQPYAIGEDFDLVFLRNVLIYFSAATRRSVVTAVMSQMAPGAMLVTGPSEGVSYLEEPRLRAVAPHVFVYTG